MWFRGGPPRAAQAAINRRERGKKIDFAYAALLIGWVNDLIAHLP